MGWVQEDNGTSPFHFRSWDDICKPKNKGGLGIRDVYKINQSLLIHSAWNIADNKNPFLTKVLKAKYFPNYSFWTASNTASKSIFWSSIMQIKHYFMRIALFKSTMVPLAFGLLLGALYGILFMITLIFLSLLTNSRITFLSSWSLRPRPGI